MSYKIFHSYSYDVLHCTDEAQQSWNSCIDVCSCTFFPPLSLSNCFRDNFYVDATWTWSRLFATLFGKVSYKNLIFLSYDVLHCTEEAQQGQTYCIAICSWILSPLSVSLLSNCLIGIYNDADVAWILSYIGNVSYKICFTPIAMMY